MCQQRQRMCTQVGAARDLKAVSSYPERRTPAFPEEGGGGGLHKQVDHRSRFPHVNDAPYGEGPPGRREERGVPLAHLHVGEPSRARLQQPKQTAVEREDSQRLQREREGHSEP